MWRVTGTDEGGGEVAATMAQVEGRPIDVQQVAALVEQLELPSRGTPRVFAAEWERLSSGQVECGLLSIDTWGPLAVQASAGQLRFEEGRLAWIPDQSEGVVRGWAWHDYSAVAVLVRPGTEKLQFSYSPEAVDRARSGYGQRYYPWEDDRRGQWPRNKIRTILNWRLYAPESDHVIDGDAIFRRKGPDFFVTNLSDIGLTALRSPALLIGKVCRSTGPLNAACATDPVWEARLESHERRGFVLARRYPRLQLGLKPAPAPKVMIVVHGTRSTTLPALSLLDAQCALAYPTFRFEHDTYRPVTENALELEELVCACWSNCVPPPEIVLLGHSRGGLVARSARAKLLRRRGAGFGLQGPGAIEVLTLGSPHQGTPLVGRALEAVWPFASYWGVGKRVLNMDQLARQGGTLMEDAIDLAHTIFRGRCLPEGIRDMAPGGSFLGALNDNPNASHYTAVGGDYRPASSHGTVKASFAKGLFGGEPNDAIVGLGSSTHGPAERNHTAQCSHFRYFDDRDVLKVLRAF